MDDNYRLIKLISLVGWTHPAENKSWLRYSTTADVSRLTEAERTAGNMMCAQYSGAVEYHQGNTDHSETMCCPSPRPGAGHPRNVSPGPDHAGSGCRRPV